MRPSVLFSAIALSFVLAVASVAAQAADEPYEVVVWADAEYSAAGELVELEFVGAKEYPEAFLANVRNRIVAREYTAPVVDGQPATFETGVRVTLTVTPGAGGGQVKIDEIADSARVLRMSAAKRPANVNSMDWNGTVVARCTVTVKGRCNLAEVMERSGLDAAAAGTFAKGSLEGWRFKPQRVNGNPIESDVVVPITLEAEGSVRPQIRGYQY